MRYVRYLWSPTHGDPCQTPRSMLLPKPAQFRRFSRTFCLALTVRIVCAWACGSLASSALAEVVYDNGGPDDEPLPGGYEMTGWLEADDFTVTDYIRIDGIKFWSLEFSGRFAGSVYWRIYSNAPGEQPGDVLAEGLGIPSRAAGRPSILVYQEWVNTLPIPPVELPPGTYWLALHNGPLSNNILQFVFWESTTQNGLRPAHQNPGPSFDDDDWYSVVVPGSTEPSPPHHAFQVQGMFVPRATAIGRVQGVPRFSFTTRLGYTYRVDYKDSLSNPTWQILPGAEMVTGTGSVVEVIDTDPAAPTRPYRFYRAVVLSWPGQTLRNF